MTTPHSRTMRVSHPLALLSITALLAACASDPSGGRGRGEDAIGEIITRETAPAAAAAPGPSPTQFIGRNVTQLERILGQPELVRREGRNEFRRYDREDCRIYAVVAPAGGAVQTLSTGPLANGQTPPSFEACTAGL